MILFNLFLSRRKSTADIAKKRLQIIVAEQRKKTNEPHYLPQLKRELFEVICKYIQINQKNFSIQIEKKDGDIFKLEVNINLSENKQI